MRPLRTAVAALALALASVALASVAHADIGVRGPSFLGGGSNVSGSKPQSKLWWNDGTWWASMWDTVSADFTIWRWSGGAWVNTGVQLDARNGSRADVLWDGTKLYVASHVFTTAPAGGFPTRFYRYSYDAAAKRYTRDAGFPVAINDFKLETVVIDKDSTGRVWATWVQNNQVFVNHTLGDDLTWGTPFVLPAADTTVLADDISSVVAFGGDRIGVMWSNQVTGAFHFAFHRDGDPVTSWTSGPVPGTTLADDHVNLKADSAGRVYAVVKRDVTPSSGQPMIVLLVRGVDGVWTSHTVSYSGDSQTRPIVQLDELNGAVHVLATGPQPPATSGQSGGDIYQKTAPLHSISFAAGVGTPVIRQDGNPDMNDVASTKQGVNTLTGLPLIATENATDFYWTNLLSLAPTTPPTADFVASPRTGVAPLAVSFTDRSGGGATAWSWSFGDGATSTAQNPSHTYAAPGVYDVTLTATNVVGSDDEVKTAYVTVSSAVPPPTADFSASPTSGTEPLDVAFTDLSTNAASWSWSFGDGGVSTERNPSHRYEAPGTYTVGLTVTNEAGTATANRTDLVSVAPLPAPVADLTGTPTAGTAPLTVAFSDRSTGIVTSWLWDFGDGTTSTASGPTHVYANAGTYTVTLTVANARGSDSKTVTDYVTAGAPQPDVGVEGPSFAGGGSSVTASKPQSKLWWNDGFWWASMWSSANGRFDIFRLDRATDTWVDTGTALDPRVSSRADVLWDGTHLYVASHVFTSNPEPGNPTRLFRYSYDAAADSYALDAGFPAQINGLKLESVVIDKDTTGTLWATWAYGSQVFVSHSVGDDSVWSTPAALPFPEAAAASDDLSSVVAFDGTVGVLWSNQRTGRFYFAVHADGAPDTAWTLETLPLTQPDDHVNLKVDASGRVWAVLKRQLPLAPDEPEIVLARRSESGAWTTATVGVASESHTRPIVLLDEEQEQVHVLMTGPQPPSPSGQTGGTIYEKVASMSELSFPAGLGTAVVRDGSTPDMNDVASTKQGVTEETGLVAIAGNDTTDRYWHASMPLVAPVRAALAGSPTAGLAPLTVTFSDLSTGHPTSWLWDFGDGTTSTQQTPSHTYTAPGVYTVTLTASKATSSDTVSVAGYVVVRPPAPVAGFTASPTSGAAPLSVAFTDTSSGAPTSWQWDFGDGGSSTEQNPAHSYLAAGTYTVTLTAANAGGSSASVTTVTVYVPPVADLVGAPLEGPAPLTVAFTDVSANAPLSWSWAFGDATTATVRHPLHTYTQPGSYSVSLTVENPAGASTITRTDYIRVTAPPPVASFSATPLSGFAPLQVQFTDSSSNGPTSWRWDFGDGQTSTERNPRHTYDARGRYTVTLTVSSATGTSTVTRESLVEVSQRVVATAVADATVRDKHNHGSKPDLRVQGDKDVQRAYLRFEVSDLPAGVPIASAKLRLYVDEGSVDGGTAYATAGGWAEQTITERNAPPPAGPGLASFGAVQALTWAEADLTAVVRGPGTYDLVIVSANRDTARYRSREGGVAPVLELTFAP